jgi:hypothetical protein
MLTRLRHEGAMKPISYKRHRFPPDTVRLPVWLYFRFTTSSRDVEELLAQRGIRLSMKPRGSRPIIGHSCSSPPSCSGIWSVRGCSGF